MVGANCAESHAWPSGSVDGAVVSLTDPSAAQIAVGKNWAAVTLTSGSVLQLPLTYEGALSGTSAAITLPSNANNTPLGEAFWGNILGFTPAHSPDSFAIVDEESELFPIVGPTPPYPTNAPCWVAKGPGSIWYTGNSPGHAISIFFSDSQGGVFYKSVPLPGAPHGHNGLSLTASGSPSFTRRAATLCHRLRHRRHGDLTPVATSNSIGVAAFQRRGVQRIALSFIFGVARRVWQRLAGLNQRFTRIRRFNLAIPRRVAPQKSSRPLRQSNAIFEERRKSEKRKPLNRKSAKSRLSQQRGSWSCAKTCVSQKSLSGVKVLRKVLQFKSTCLLVPCHDGYASAFLREIFLRLPVRCRCFLRSTLPLGFQIVSRFAPRVGRML